MMQSPFSLTDKTILVTGASSGLGRQTCIAISEMGGKVIATGRNPERLEETMSMLTGEGHIAHLADLVNFEDRKQLVQSLPKLNGFVHSAGISRIIPLKYLTDDLLDEVHTTNFEAPAKLTRDMVKARVFMPSSSIVYVGSIAPMLGIPGQCAYSSSKAALMALARVFAMEVVSQKIRVNSVAPAMVKTPIMEGAAVSKEQYDLDEKSYPLGYGEPEDVANAIVFLLSSASKWITGTTMILDGGLICK